MRPFVRWLFALAAVLCVFSTGAQPYWQSRLQVSVGTVASPAYTFRGTNFTNGSTSVQTASIDIGTASADRLVIVAIQYQNTPVVTSVTANAVTLNLDIVKTTNPSAAIYSGLVTSGSGPQNIVVNYVSAGFSNRGLTVWTATGLSSNVVKNTASSANANISINITAGDFLFASTYQATATWNYSASTDTATATHTSDATNFSGDWTTLTTSATYTIGLLGNISSNVGASYR